MENFSCPACESLIAVDGQALVERSARLAELEGYETKVPNMIEAVKKLRAQLKEASVVPAPPPDPKRKPKSKVKPKQRGDEDEAIWQEFFGN